ncbi:hypothetical protein [Mucilaginibacter celer]|uniref:Uncharacterized protein n=1 Tax=Mucilaginibacter celer TaxID=2305508 RepID=A0A494VW02_9SPHI|nr:hypothetical protein [Mucilaginibacter celer]AYL99174.1 hypothetical protein HYN43_029610 [Mucilaginibacter celer]
MKKSLLTLTTIVALFFGACKKDDNKPNNNGGDTYQPFSANSTWKYKNTNTFTEGADIDTTTNTMSAETKKIGAKTYHVLNTLNSGDADKAYLGFDNHIYTTLQEDSESGETMELEYLNDNVAAGTSWSKDITIGEGEGSAQGRLKTTIAEKGISKVVLGKTYNNVIHSTIELQIKVGANYQTQLTQDFYIAKGIGAILINAKTPTKQLTKSELISYNIK